MMNRKLTGCFIRRQNPETKKWENKDISDLPFDDVVKWFKRKKKGCPDWEKYVLSVLGIYHDTLFRVANEFNITTE
jgi:hypothetical protein